jgi:hypothetical protein
MSGFAVEQPQAVHSGGAGAPLRRAPIRIGPVDDPAEHEAERVAERVLSRAPAGVLQRACACGGTPGPDGECAACRAKRLGLQRSASGGPPGVDVAPPIVHDVLSRSGRPIDGPARSFFEQRLGMGLGSVRVHTDERAAASARAVDAMAYTVGNDVVFDSGRYAPETVPGRRLLAHELAHVAQQRRGAPALQRYSHEDCTEDDLRNHVWPADYIARQMVKKAIRVLSAKAIDPSVAALFPKYFMTSSPQLGSILHVYDAIDVEFSANDYTYECEDDCGGTKFGYVWGLWSDIHLCMNHLRGKANACIARTIVHEFSHYYAGTDDNGYCKTGCEYDTCPSTLTESKALENADSYACFAYELWPMGV